MLTTVLHLLNRRLKGMAVRGACLAALVVGFIPLSASAQEPPALSMARANFLRQLLSESQTLTDQYERALARVEVELAAAGDYEEARLVQQRRLELKSLYVTSSPDVAQSLATPLTAATVRTLGSTETRGDLITGWRTNGSMAEWANVKITPGKYYLEFEANMVQVPGMLSERAQPQERVNFEFFEVSLLAGVTENRRSFDLGTSSDEGTFAPQRIGPLTFTRSISTFRLTGAMGYPANVIRFRNLRLVPATQEAPTLSATANTSSVDDLHKSLITRLKAEQTTAIQTYLTQLTELSKQQPPLKEAIEAESKRANRMLREIPTSTALVPRSLIALGGLAGFEDLENARFVSDPMNNGSSFLIEHEGRRIPIRLLWVFCAPIGDKDKDELRQFARHFRIEEEDAAGIGRLAQEFTAGYLEGKALRVLLRPNKDKNGVTPALVFLPEVGLYQNTLIDQGMAAVQPGSKETRRSLMENTFISGLQRREEHARSHQPAPGAWALSENGNSNKDR